MLPFARVFKTLVVAPPVGKLVTLITRVCSAPLFPSPIVDAVNTFVQVAFGPALKRPGV